MGNSDSDELKMADFIWDEYKYRHQHVWKLILQITAAVVAVSIIPYILNEDVEKKVGHFIIALPLIGLALTILGTLRIRKECSILDKIREKHRDFHKLKYEILYSNKESTFTEHVIAYFISLITLGAVNVSVVAINAFACG